MTKMELLCKIISENMLTFKRKIIQKMTVVMYTKQKDQINCFFLYSTIRLIVQISIYYDLPRIHSIPYKQRVHDTLLMQCKHLCILKRSF